MTELQENLFNFAPKELTNSAMWAWVISALRSGDDGGPRYKIARNIFDELHIPMPLQSDIAELHTERSFKTIQKHGVTVKGAAARLDVFLRVEGNEPFVLFIENKVVENEIRQLYEQIKGYDDRFQSICQQVPGYAQDIYPAYFGYEDWVAEKLAELASGEDKEFAQRLRVFPVSKMIGVFEGTGFEEDPILSQFYQWLQVKKNFVTIRRQARLSDHANLADVIEAGKDVGYGELLDRFMSQYEACSHFKRLIKFVRPDIRNINFYQAGAAKKTPLTIRWFYNSGFNGLYIGIHEDVAAMTGINLFQNLPSHYAYEKDAKWIFGYLKTPQEIERFWSV